MTDLSCSCIVWKNGEASTLLAPLLPLRCAVLSRLTGSPIELSLRDRVRPHTTQIVTPRVCTTPLRTYSGVCSRSSLPVLGRPTCPPHPSSASAARPGSVPSVAVVNHQVQLVSVPSQPLRHRCIGSACAWMPTCMADVLRLFPCLPKSAVRIRSRIHDSSRCDGPGNSQISLVDES